MADQRESIRSDEQLDEALDEFERCWSSDIRYLPDFVAKHHEVNNPQSLAELVRADIDRRYAADLDVDLTVYTITFPTLRGDHRNLWAIGFEDFRSRRSRSLPLPSNRWSWIPGIEQASWFAALQEVAVHPATSSSQISQIQKTHIGTAKRRSDAGAVVEMSSASSANREPKVGDRFGEFQLLAILGKGSFSTVFLATQLGLAGRYVALKVVRRPLDEPTHLARLQHTGIVPLFSLHRIGPHSALCMPYFGSATLADWIGDCEHPSRDGQSLVGTVQSAQMRLTTVEASPESDSLNPTEIEDVRVWNAAGAQPLDKLRSLDTRQFILWLAQRLTAALAHAHERGVIHGDLKPANVLLRNDGEPALIDFNLSKNVGRDEDAWAGGTLPYMSPEQLQMLLGQPKRIDASTDVYSLGIMLFELAENRLPFPRPLSQAESDVKLALDSRQQPSAMTNSSASSGLKAIIRKCLNLSPNERYASALSLLEDIELEIANRPLLHARESLIAGRLPKLLRRYPRFFSVGPIALISFLAISLLASVAVMGWKKFNVSDAQARFTHFQAESKLLLAELVEPAPNQWEELLGASNRLTNDLLGKTSNSTEHTSRDRFENTLKWLSPADRAAAEKDYFEFCLAAVALTCSSVKELNDFQREQVQELLLRCTSMSRSAKAQALLDKLQELVQSDEQQLETRYESVIRSLEMQVDATDSDDQERGLIELLQARSDVRQGLARQAMERLQSIDVKRTPAHLYWMVSGDAQSQLEQREAAIQAYGLAIAAAPKSAAAFVKRAQELQSLRNFKSSEREYTQAIGLAPSTATLHMRRALVREQLRDFDGAIQDMNAALELEPESNRLLFTRARLHQLANHRINYREDFRSGVSTTPKLVDDWVSRALAQLPRHPDKAKADLQAALHIDPKSLVALQNLAHVESEHLHDMAAAMSALDQILAWSPENESARAGRSVLLARLGRDEECLQDLNLLSQREQKVVPSTLYQMGCAHALISPRSGTSADTAVRLLAQAIRRGYGADIIATDPDLDALREHASFDALMTIAKFYRAN